MIPGSSTSIAEHVEGEEGQEEQNEEEFPQMIDEDKEVVMTKSVSVELRSGGFRESEF